MRIISQEVADGLLATRPEDRVCRRCGCTEADCAFCIKRTGLRCGWVEADLCSACAPIDKTDPLYFVRMFQAQVFVYRLSALDVTAVALSALHGAEESDVAFVIDTYFTLRRGLASHRNTHYAPPRLSVAGGILANVIQAFMGQADIQIAQKTLTNLSAQPALLAGALSGPSMEPFVYPPAAPRYDSRRFSRGHWLRPVTPKQPQQPQQETR